MKIRLVGADLGPADGRTDMTKIIVAFRNFKNASKKSKLCCSYRKILTAWRNRMVQSNILETSI